VSARDSTYGYQDIAGMIDHALLAPTLDRPELEAGLDLAERYGVASVCILPYYVARAAERLAGGPVRVTTTIGFPHGGQARPVKVFEAEQALSDGAVELDLVVNVGLVRSGDFAAAGAEVGEIVRLCHARGRKLKLIFENAYLEQHQKIRLCELSTELEVDWVKTSTGFGPSGATLADVALMRQRVPPRVEVKASGGIRDLSMLLAFRSYVTRVGTSSTAKILDECRERLGLAPIGAA
jgi:deoxyribose-phosphate aldolase